MVRETVAEHIDCIHGPVGSGKSRQNIIPGESPGNNVMEQDDRAIGSMSGTLDDIAKIVMDDMCLAPLLIASHLCICCLCQSIAAFPKMYSNIVSCGEHTSAHRVASATCGPRRARYRAKILIALFSSRSNINPHSVQTYVRL